MRYIARSGGLLGYADLVRQHGGNPLQLLDDIGLPAQVLTSPDLYIPYQRMAELMEHSATQLRAPGFGVALGQRQGLDVVGALASHLCRESHIASAMMVLQRHLGFHARGIEMTVTVQDDALEIRLDLAFQHRQPSHQLMALSLSLLDKGLRDLQHDHLPPRNVRMSGPPPAGDSATRYHDVFRCPVRFNAECNAVIYPAALLLQPVQVAPALQARLARLWRDDWSQPSTASLITQVERAISALLPTGECRLDTVANLVGLHPRTLQEQLKACENSFTHTLERVRHDLACQHLCNSDIRLTRLALDLGYADVAVFSRAFRRWSGQSPRRWRQDNRNIQLHAQLQNRHAGTSQTGWSDRSIMVDLTDI